MVTDFMSGSWGGGGVISQDIHFKCRVVAWQRSSINNGAIWCVLV